MENGVAIPPAAMGTSIGVSTSINPFSSINRLIEDTNLLLDLADSIAASFAIKSRYLCLNLVSVSVSPCHFSGRGRKALQIMWNSDAWADIWPVRVRNIAPWIPIQSPISSCSKISYCSPIWFWRRSIWMVPSPSEISRKVAFPIPRLATTRPANATSIFSDGSVEFSYSVIAW